VGGDRNEGLSERHADLASSRDELEKEWMKADPVSYSQHSSIVASEYAPSHAMAFDLAIGQCRAFDYKAGKFWEDLLHRADWRDPQNGFKPAVDYYRAGKLPEALTKWFMNKPDDVCPKVILAWSTSLTMPQKLKSVVIGVGIRKSQICNGICRSQNLTGSWGLRVLKSGGNRDRETSMKIKRIAGIAGGSVGGRRLQGLRAADAGGVPV
jgi:hypothetical protein